MIYDRLDLHQHRERGWRLSSILELTARVVPLDTITARPAAFIGNENADCASRRTKRGRKVQCWSLAFSNGPFRLILV